jgi:uncharacterized repeat protein (TIGR03803 family)
MTKLSAWKTACAVLIFCAAASAQTLTTLASFDGTNGEYPSDSLVQGLNGNFYGTTNQGGANHAGTVFEITSAGQLMPLYNFCSQTNCADGGYSSAGLTLATNGNLYGTTANGGANPSCDGGGGGCGTVFEITPKGQLTTLYSFCVQDAEEPLSNPYCTTDGAQPFGSLLQAANGNFYGTTSGAGGNSPGTVFEMTPAGKLTTIYTFCSQGGQYCTDGFDPFAGLVQAADGNLYGTTDQGGNGHAGTVFRITLGGKLATLYTFCRLKDCTNGSSPRTPLVQATNGNLYGTTIFGGANCPSEICGTIFEITPSGKLSTLYSFCSQPNCTDGEWPMGLMQGTDGNLYGTTLVGGANGEGTVYEITESGQLSTLYSFCSQPNCADGGPPSVGLIQGTDGNFYGTTVEGGDSACNSGCGTVFRLSTGLSPFVETLPATGNVGAEVGILGNSLMGATSVTFNGIPAQFTVKSSTLMVTHVPTGATTGTVQVTLPTGTLTSNVPFHVIP